MSADQPPARTGAFAKPGSASFSRLKPRQIVSVAEARSSLLAESVFIEDCAPHVEVGSQYVLRLAYHLCGRWDCHNGGCANMDDGAALSRPTSGREGDAPCGFLTFRFRDGPSAVVISSVFDNPFDVSRGEISDVANFDVSYTGAWFGRRMNTLWFDADVGALENLSFASPRLIRVNSRFPEPIGRYAQIAGGGYEPPSGNAIFTTSRGKGQKGRSTGHRRFPGAALCASMSAIRTWASRGSCGGEFS